MSKVAVSAHHSSPGTGAVGTSARLCGSLLFAETLSLFRLALQLFNRISILSDLFLQIVDLSLLAVQQGLYFCLLTCQLILKCIQLSIFFLKRSLLLFDVLHYSLEFLEHISIICRKL